MISSTPLPHTCSCPEKHFEFDVSNISSDLNKNSLTLMCDWSLLE